MHKGVHVLFDMDKQLSDGLDQMILDVSKTVILGTGRRSLDDLIGRSSWQDALSRIGKTLSRMADPDAAEIVPIFKDIFDDKKTMIKAMDMGQSLKDHVLFALSEQRKLLGIDHRRFKNDDQAQRLEIAH